MNTFNLIFIFIISFTTLVNSAPPRGLDNYDYDLDTLGLDELGAINDIDIFKLNLGLFGVDLSESEELISASNDVKIPKEKYPDTFIHYNSKTALDIVEGRPLADQVWLFLSENEGHFETILPTIEALPRIFQGQLLFVICNIDDPTLRFTLESVRVKSREAPTARIIYIGPEAMDIYKPDQDVELNFDTLKTFAEKYFLKQLTRLPAGQYLPDDWEQRPVKYLVADNYQQFLQDNKNKRIVVKYYSPTCKACITFAETYEAVARDLENEDDLVMAEIDITQNELKDRIIVLPTVKIIEDGKIVHEGNGLSYDDLKELVLKSDLNVKRQNKSLDFDL